jgi:hypothetical protein
VQGLSYEVRRGRKESGVRIAKPSTICVVKSFKRRNVCIMYGCRMRRTSNFFGLGAGGMDIEVEVGEEGCL